MSVRGRFFVLENYWSNQNEGRLEDCVFSNKYRWEDRGETTVLSVKDFLRFLESYGTSDDYDLYKDRLEGWSLETPVYIFKCKDCGKEEFVTLNTLNKRGMFVCKDCQEYYRRLRLYGSMKDNFPEIEKYYAECNDKPYDKIISYKYSREKVYLICPRCNETHYARLDYVIGSNAYCTQCKKHINKMANGGSLRDFSDRVADMYEGGNPGKSASDIAPYKVMKARFRCDNGGKEHFFVTDLSSMCNADKKGNLGCPVCAGFQVYEGINDFASRCPEAASMWDYDRNEGITPTEVSYNSNVDYWFICPEGHSFHRDPLHIIRYLDTNGFNGCTVCSGKDIQSGINDLATLVPEVLDYWVWERNILDPSMIGKYSNQSAWFRCRDCNCEFEYPINQWVNTMGRCPDCRLGVGYSKAEKEIADYIKSLGFVIEENKRFCGIELDIFIPSLNIAFEYNGLYYHSTAVRPDKNYHKHKYDVCKKSGIKLYYIWEDDYITNQDVVKKMISNKLGVGADRKINARDCSINNSVPMFSAREFCNANHIQGFTGGSIYIGLENADGELVALGVFKVIDFWLRLERYCTSCNVRGGFSKILKEVESLGYDGVYTFSDNGVSDGDLYVNNGFVLVDELSPDYSYIVDGRRSHKFNYRISRFKRDNRLKYEEGLSERELALLNGIERVYDAGKKKWYKEFSKPIE